MLYLLLAILSSSMIAVIMRISADKVSANVSMLAVNYTICTLLSAAYAGFDLISPEIPGFSLSTWLGIISGFFYLGGFVLFQTSTRRNGVVLTSVFMKLGLLVPIVVSVIAFREIPTVIQSLGFFLAVFAIVLINLKKDNTNRGMGFGLLLLLLTGGGGDAIAKIFEKLAPAELSDQYLFYTFGMALLLSILLVLYQKEHPGYRELLFGAIIGVPNFFSSKFLLGALTKLPAVVVFPSFSVGTMLIVTLTGIIVFKERLSKLQWFALTTIITALILLNI